MNVDEHISALMDGELNEAETGRLLDQLQRDAGLRMCWTRYHLISDALRSDLTCHIKHNVANRVIQVLESEPIHLSPRRTTPHSSRLTPHIFKPLAGLAMAASIAAVAVLSLQTTAPLQTVSPVNLAGLPGVAQVSSAAGRSRWSAGRPSVESKLDIYLANHNQYSMSTEMQGMLPYARIVGYETNP